MHRHLVWVAVDFMEIKFITECAQNASRKYKLDKRKASIRLKQDGLLTERNDAWIGSLNSVYIDLLPSIESRTNKLLEFSALLLTDENSTSSTTEVPPSSSTQADTKAPTTSTVDTQNSTTSSKAPTSPPSDPSNPSQDIAETISPKPSQQEEKIEIPAKHRLSVDYQDTPESSSSPLSSAAEATASPSPSDNSEKPVQLNKGRCYKCRVKIPLAKQTVNKCRCNYTFCDAHRYPDRHDCDVDYAKLGRDLLAKNNPKLNERPKGGRTFQRIDSL
ncbi:hypothetical protein INT43_003283 [Umbelopsis isabellina]|uniref:AN1-type domain-containing protein n=1 Tax=Mortierella isabellina TaxID=91625 RepID=A0A8H7PQG5_MORIS|nr:hypothetical protein INT43_003283 [Umbelopsis isabellina]